MSAVFTQHAVERMRQVDFDQRERDLFLRTVERVAKHPNELVRSGNVVRIKRQHGADAFIVQAGDMRAVLAVNPAEPEQVIVMSVYRGEETEAEQTRLGLRADPVAAAE